MVRLFRPTSSTRPPRPWRMTTVAASHARRRDVPAETWKPSIPSSADWPTAAQETRRDVPAGTRRPSVPSIPAWPGAPSFSSSPSTLAWILAIPLPSIPPSPVRPVTSTCTKPDSRSRRCASRSNAAGSSFLVRMWCSLSRHSASSLDGSSVVLLLADGFVFGPSVLSRALTNFTTSPESISSVAFAFGVSAQTPRLEFYTEAGRRSRLNTGEYSGQFLTDSDYDRPRGAG